MSLLPWAKERFRTAITSLNGGFPDWEDHSNTFSFEYPGALPTVNPLISVSLKVERSMFSLKKVVLGVAQVPLRKLEIQPNKYNDYWYPLYRDGKRTGARVRVSFMLCPSDNKSDLSDRYPQKTHYFEKQIIDPKAFSEDCPVCRKSLILGLGGIVDTIYRCRICHMAVHGNCRERAKGIFMCTPKEKTVERSEEEKEVEDISEKFLRTIKGGGVPIYNQPIGYL